MPLRTYGNKRDDIEDDVVQAYLAAHCSVYALDTPADLLVGRVVRGVPTTFLIEVKSEKGKHTPAQVKFLATWRGQYHVVRSVDEALAAVGIET